MHTPTSTWAAISDIHVITFLLVQGVPIGILTLGLWGARLPQALNPRGSGLHNTTCS